MTKHIELRHDEWHQVKEKLVAEHGTKILVSWVMKRELGFSIREHSRRIDKDTYRFTNYRDQISVMCVDFYSEEAKTYFLLRFM